MSRWRGRTVLISSLPGTVCLGLALLIHDELTNPPVPPASQEALAGPVAVDPLPPEAVASQAALELFAAVIERPVFSPTRRPPEEPAPSAPEPTPFVQNPGFSLAGITISEKGRFVLAVPDSGIGGVVRVAEGRSIDGWTVARVEPDRALFRQGETEILMILEFFERSAASPNNRN